MRTCVAHAMLIALSGMLLSCSRAESSRGATVQLPQGTAKAGRAVFEKARCFTCHEVADENFPHPVLDPPAPRMTATVAAQPPDEIADSIVAPSHKISGSYTGVAEGGELSKMGDMAGSLTVQDVADLVAYIRSIRGM
jgi:cytochrome c553